MSNRSTKIVMIGPSLDGLGGVSSVARVYKDYGFFERWDIDYLETHVDGNARAKIFAAITSYCRFLVIVLSRRDLILHAHVSERSSFWRKGLFIATTYLRGGRVIIHLHAPEFHEFYSKELGALRRRIANWLITRADVVIALSTHWKKVVEDLTRHRNVVRIFNPISLPSRSTSVLKTGGRTILFLGRLGMRKGIYDLLAAFQTVLLSNESVKLFCGGDGDIEGAKCRAGELGLDGAVEFLGWVAGDKKELLLSNCSVYVLPSYNEGLPMGILEAMAHGLPVVSTFVGGIPDAVLNGKTGYLVEPGDVRGLSVALLELLNNPINCEKLGRAGVEHIRANFVPEKVIPQVEALYSALGALPLDINLNRINI